MKTRWVDSALFGELGVPSKLVYALIFILSFADPVLAKMYEKPASSSLEKDSLEQVQRVDLKPIDVESLLAEDRAYKKGRAQEGPQRFAVAADVDFSLDNVGTWRKLTNGLLWRLRIQSPGAKSLNLGIVQFDMPEGAKLWIYDPEYNHVEGPYTAKDRSRRGSLWTPVIEGDEIVVEVFIPVGVSKPGLKIGKVNQGYRGFLKNIIDGNTSEAACEIDVICPQGDPWRDQIRAVGFYHITGTSFCSGTLLNNPYRKPYFLSSAHCHIDSGNDHTLVFYWNYESTACGTHSPGPTDQNQMGSIYRASYDTSDFLLLELLTSPRFNPYYAGWDASGATPLAAVGIHHPAGDVKAISLSNRLPGISAYLETTDNPSGSYWRVRWDEGITEGGSSGSCLFANDNTKRCIGQLRGGYSACDSADLNDWYGQFSASWIGGGAANSRLSDWLDPGNTGVSSISGEPHITTVNGVHYDFQGAGEFIAFRDTNGLEIQTRHAPIATTSRAGPDPYDEIATCVSFNTAVAARVGNHRVTYQPKIEGGGNSGEFELRIDGTLAVLGSKGIYLEDGGRIVNTIAPDGIEIDFPDKTVLFVTPGEKSFRRYLNLDLIRVPAMNGVGSVVTLDSVAPTTGGIMGAILPGAWLPALPDGSSMGAMPNTVHQRFLDLYGRFANAWRVTNATSLFDYAPGTSTDTFSQLDWPPETSACAVPETKEVQPQSLKIAQDSCKLVTSKATYADCVFDVMATGNVDFARTHALSQRIRDGSTVTRIVDSKNITKFGEPVSILATVARTIWSDKSVPKGTVQFSLDGEETDDPIPLDAQGRANWTTSILKPGKHVISAVYTPNKESRFLTSIGFDHIHYVEGDKD